MFKTSNLFETLLEVLPHVENVLISGPPGIGKSEIIYGVARWLDKEVFEVRLYEQGDAAVGYPIVSKITSFTKPFWFHEIERRKPDIILFDDFHLVDSSIQKFLYRMLTSRMIHNFALPYNPTVIFAGNFNLDSASACEVQSPIMSRIDVAITFEPSADTFIEWGFRSCRIDERILAFIKANPDLLYTPDPPTTKMYPCPRSWEKFSRLLKATNDPSLAPGVVGEEAGARFLDFWPLLGLNPRDIIRKDPSSLSTAEKVAAAFILSEIGPSILRGEITPHVKEVLSWIEKLDPDLIFLFARTAVSRCSRNGAGEQEVKREFVRNLFVASETVFRKVTEIAAALVEGTGDQERIREVVEQNVRGVKNLLEGGR